MKRLTDLDGKCDYSGSVSEYVPLTRGWGFENRVSIRTDSLHEAVSWVRKNSHVMRKVELFYNATLIIEKRLGVTWLTDMLSQAAPELDDFEL